MLSDLGEIVGGGTPSTKAQENYENGTISWITPKDLAGLRRRFISQGERNITEQGLRSCSAQMMPKGTILFSSRAPIGYVAIANNELCTNQGFKSIVPNAGTDFLFLYYLLVYNKNRIENVGIGTTFKEVSAKTMRGISVRVPTSIIHQKRIADILSMLDERIEYNQAINKNLEEQAQAIFAHLFSDRPYHLGTLSQIADVIMGQSPRGESYNETKSGALFFQGRADFGFRFPTPRLYTTEPKRMAQAGDVLLSVRAPVGDLNIALEPCCIGRGIAAIRSIDGHPSFLFYCLLSQKDQFDIFNGEGTVFGSINSNALKSMEVRIPPKKLLDHFEEMVAPIDTVIRVTSEEILYLTALRDTLLPRLMSGELDVSSIEI